MSASGEMKKLLRAAEAAGAQIRSGHGSHKKVYVDGRLVTIVSSHAKGHSGDLKASARAPRRAGLEITA